MLEKIIRWGEREKAVRALILAGSRGGEGIVDQFSDYDLAVICDDDRPFTESEEWLSQFGKVWVYVKDRVFFEGKAYPSRLVIFEGGIKVDFSFLDRAFSYPGGFKVLLDKEGVVVPQGGFVVEGPSEEEFQSVVKEFWFEVYHVGIYLKRGDLWQVKSRSQAAQTFLLKMIEWNSKEVSLPGGRRMASWVSKEVWGDLHGIFAHFDAEDSWKALFNVMELFKRLSESTAVELGYSSQEEFSANMGKFIADLKGSL